MAKVERMTMHGERHVLYALDCPACKVSHAIRTACQDDGAQVLDFNGDLDKPTFYPAVLAPSIDEATGQPIICHFYVTAGRIRYLPDCTHDQAGKEIELPNLDPIDPG